MKLIPKNKTLTQSLNKELNPSETLFVMSLLIVQKAQLIGLYLIEIKNLLIINLINFKI